MNAEPEDCCPHSSKLTSLPNTFLESFECPLMRLFTCTF